MAIPTFKTALPKRRFKYGEFMVSALAEIDSNDGQDYWFVLAFVPEGQPVPTLCVASQVNTEDDEGSHRLRMYTSNDARDLGASDNWKNLDTFVEAGLELGGRVLKLGDEEPFRLM